MRFFAAFFSLVCLACASIAAFALDVFATSWSGMKGHYHLMPHEPRSIADTRRMGLA